MSLLVDLLTSSGEERHARRCRKARCKRPLCVGYKLGYRDGYGSGHGAGHEAGYQQAMADMGQS